MNPSVNNHQSCESCKRVTWKVYGAATSLKVFTVTQGLISNAIFNMFL